jgi:hypothetical protein
MVAGVSSPQTLRHPLLRQFMLVLAAVFLLTSAAPADVGIDPLKRQEMERLLNSGGRRDNQKVTEFAQFVLLPVLVVGGLVLLIRKSMLP